MKPNPLAGLHGFYQPTPPSWAPQTWGWYVLFALLALAVLWLAWRVYAWWRRNRYRRYALRELADADIHAIPELLKRTALAAWPRETVASLSGSSWVTFLAETAGDKSCGKSFARALVDVDYRDTVVSPQDELNLRKAAEEWIRKHRVHA